MKEKHKSLGGLAKIWIFKDKELKMTLFRFYYDKKAFTNIRKRVIFFYVRYVLEKFQGFAVLLYILLRSIININSPTSVIQQDVYEVS